LLVDAYPVANARAARFSPLTFEEKWTIRNEHGRFRGVSTLFNIGLYLLIAHKDIQAIKIDALTHPDEWTRKLLARIILLTIFEWDAEKFPAENSKRRWT
jgi:hypothetical protein